MSPYAGQMREMCCAASSPAALYLQTDASPPKMLFWSTAADVHQNHPALKKKNGYCSCSVREENDQAWRAISLPNHPLYSRIPTLSVSIGVSRSKAAHMTTPLWWDMTSPARDRVNLACRHVSRDTYFVAFQAHETRMLSPKVKLNTESACLSFCASRMPSK